MNCQDIKYRISELVDGALPPGQSKEIRAHLKRCTECRREYNLLRTVAGALAELPMYEPGRQFNDRILAAIGCQPVSRQVPAWQKWSIALGLSLALIWTGVVVYALSSRLSVIDALKALQLAARPGEALSALSLYAVKLGFAVSDVLDFVFKLGSLALKDSSLPLQLGLASVIAFGLISLISHRTRIVTY
ncbi:MAG: zf-HC2 domain-containing protein [Candidatus Edwardsbacteria bacterium]|nr:zf-HC2 domain-containing protein [Candidatus Edwardsbacteria bacterium]